MADYTQLWETILLECGETQQDQSETTGMAQSNISEKLYGATGSKAERWAVAVAAACLIGKSQVERSKIVERAKALKDLADGA